MYRIVINIKEAFSALAEFIYDNVEEYEGEEVVDKDEIFNNIMNGQEQGVNA